MRKAALEAVARASLLPLSPVHALALPEFRTTALALPPVLRSLSMETTTGAAFTLFVVKRPAQTASVEHSTMARSSPSFLTPDLTPDALKPRGSVTPPSTHCKRSTYGYRPGNVSPSPSGRPNMRFMF